MTYPRLTNRQRDPAHQQPRLSIPSFLLLPKRFSKELLDPRSFQLQEIFVPANQLLQTQTSPLTLLLSLCKQLLCSEVRSECFPGLQRGVSPWAAGEYWAVNSKGRHCPCPVRGGASCREARRIMAAFDSRLIGFCPVSPCAILRAATEDRLLFNFRLLYSSPLARSLLYNLVLLRT